MPTRRLYGLVTAPPKPVPARTDDAGRSAASISGSWAGLTATDAGWQQAGLMAVIIALTTAFAAAGLGVVGRLFFIAAALAAASFYIRRSPWQYMTLVIWFWTVTPLARRLIDFYAGFDPVNFILVTPNLLTLFMLKNVLTSRELLRQKEAFPGLMLLLPILYGLAVNLAQGEILQGAVASADWIGPLLFYFYILANWRRIPAAEVPFRNFLSVNGLVLISYGLVQFLAPAPWDAAWLTESGMTSSMGHPVAYGLRVFSTVNSTGPFAVWLGTILLLFLHFRTRLSVLLMPAGAVVLLLTQVRSEVGAILAGFVLAGLIGRASTIKALGLSLAAIMLVIAGISVIDPEMTTIVAARLATITNLGDDVSAQARTDIYEQTPALINDHPFGLGIGGTGRGALVGNQADMVVVDSGPLAVYLSLGWVGATVYFFGLILVVAQCLLAARAIRSPAATALAIAALTGASTLVFTNVTGFLSAILWICAAYATALGKVSGGASAEQRVP